MPGMERPGTMLVWLLVEVPKVLCIMYEATRSTARAWQQDMRRGRRQVGKAVAPTCLQTIRCPAQLGWEGSGKRYKERRRSKARARGSALVGEGSVAEGGGGRHMSAGTKAGGMPKRQPVCAGV